MKKTFILTIALCMGLLPVFGQNQQPIADNILKITSAKLSELSVVSYDYTREINNIKNNYYNKSKAKCFINFDNSKAQTLSKFQLTGGDFAQIYNGSEYFMLSKKEKTIDIIERPTDTAFKDFSYFYNSIPTLKNLFEKIIKDETIGKSVKDTVVGNINYKLIKLALPNKSINIIGFNKFSIELTVYYDILVELKSGLPYQIIEHNSRDKDQYQVTTTFTNINTNPNIPMSLSWYYSTYQKDYQAKIKQEYVPLIKATSEVNTWTLPVFMPSKNLNVSKEDFKGKIVMLDFWIKNCGPCMESFPFLKELQEKYGDKNFQLLTINAYDDEKDINFFYKREKPTYLMLYNGQKFGKQLGVSAYPTIIILGKDGKVIYSELGFDKEKVEQVIKANL